MSGFVYYSLAKGEINIGRHNGDPKPEIIIGAYGIKPNHAKIVLKDNGLFELSVCDDEAAASTMVNGKQMPKKKKKIINHLDRITFANSVIYVFYYPLLNMKTLEVMEKNAAESEESASMEVSLRKEQAWNDILQDGISGFETSKCDNYPHYAQDRSSVDWDMAFKEVEDCIRAGQAKQKSEIEK